MKTRYKISKRKSAFTVFLLFFFATLFVIITPRIGTFLVRQDKLQKADAMVLLMGSFPERILHATDLYKTGVAGKLIYAEEGSGALQLLRERGVILESSTEICRRVAITLGIPPDSIILLPGKAQSTQMEAIIVRDFLKTKPGIDTLIIVTSAAHTRRAGMIFGKALGEMDNQIVIYTSPSKYSGYTGVKWWKDREDIQQVVFEYIKMLNFLVFEQWEL